MIEDKRKWTIITMNTLFNIQGEKKNTIVGYNENQQNLIIII